MTRVADLKELCLDSIAKNLVFHSKIFQEAKGCEEFQFMYNTFQFVFSDQLLKRICDIHCNVFENIGDPETRRFADYLFSGSKWKGNNLQSCLNLVFNRFSKNIFVSCRFCIRKRKVPWKVTSHIFSKCVAPHKVDLSSSNLKQSDFLRALPKWHNVIKLDLTDSNCTNRTVFKIWESLPDLKELCLNDCSRISDKCLYYLCKSCCWETTKTPFCEGNGSCTTMGKKLLYFDISYTKVSDSGIACALLHLQSLKHLENDVNIETEACSVASGVVKASEICIKNGHPLLRLQLGCITCTKLLTPEKLKQVLSVCPSLKSLRLFASPQNLDVLAKYPSDTVEDVFLHFTSADILDSSAFQNFLLKIGDHLAELGFGAVSGTLKTRHIVDILKHCPNLRKFFVGKLSFIGESNYDDVYNIPESVKKLTELSLFAKVFNQEPLVTFFVQVIKKAEDLEVLNMSCCFMSHIGSRLEENILQRLKTNW